MEKNTKKSKAVCVSCPSCKAREDVTFDEKTGRMGMMEKKIKDTRNRFIFALIFSIPAVLWSYQQWLWDLPEPVPLSLFLLAVVTPPIIYSGWPMYKNAFSVLWKTKRANADLLMSMGVLVAYFYSVAATFFISGPLLYYSTASLLVMFVLLGKYLHMLAMGRTGEAIQKLMKLQAKTARVMRDSKELEIPIEEVKKGDVMIIRPGEKIPTDGIIIEGETSIDESLVTGESMPIDKKAGDEVIGATINKFGSIKAKAEKVGKETFLSQVIELVKEAQQTKPPIQEFADRVASYFVPIVLVIAILSFGVWYITGSLFLTALTFAISVLVIACPCAIGIASPLAMMKGLGLGARNGILIRRGEALEKAAKINTIVFDKTGTLTKGKPEVVDVISLESTFDENMILRLAASVEKNSEHPLAEAIVKKAKEKRLNLFKTEKFSAVAGKGVKAVIKEENFQFKWCCIGNRALMVENNIKIDDKKSVFVKELEEKGKTSMIIALDSIVIGVIAVADTLQDYTTEAVTRLRQMGFQLYMLTGDNKRTAKAIAKKIGIDHYLAEVLPKYKVDEIKKLQKQGLKTAMVGDGINDAPALTQADLGIAIGAGTDVAIESGDVVLIKHDLRDIVAAIELGRRSLLKIKQNLFWAFFYNTILIPVAAGVLYPFWQIKIRPEFAALAMIVSLSTVVGNSLLFERFNKKLKQIKKNI